MAWTCPECENEDNEQATCDACGEAQPADLKAAAAAAPAGDKVVGLVVECEVLGQPKDKLKKLTVDVGGAKPLTIVTNAPNIREAGSRVVVAMIGAVLTTAWFPRGSYATGISCILRLEAIFATSSL
jgi:tRNA-binding EMAP/Myf-like protein